MSYSKVLREVLKSRIESKREINFNPVQQKSMFRDLLDEIDRLQSIVDKFNIGFVNSKHVETPEPPFRKSIDARGNEIALQFEEDA